ncbi:uncharacterized protein BCR38DRAFT_482414 [Pseudomassariella vexata]|uniref:ribonuclease H n=1 Tax=Pseudomassariella vexata TaxID=1141098 RepID=A0A1Y2EBJ3_9PEZI|nr:uncharacterized protein BCR38DRAFT_482414 [Pseudomassariella vexata]ORY68940.1 hypothetical protein BCR38DRAFT_482414 [Pseudomassariella vexata]
MPFSFYAVARGRRPGIYPDWDSCKAQVDKFKGNRYQGYNSMQEAEEYMRMYGASDCSSLVNRSQQAGPASSLPFRERWKPYPEIARSQRVKASSKAEYRKSRNKYYKKRSMAVVQEVIDLFFSDPDLGMLKCWQRLCRAVRIEPRDTENQCKADLRGTLVNIFDLIEAVHENKPVPVWPLEQWAEFKNYTRKPANYLSREIAKDNEILACFLQDLTLAQPRRCGSPRPLVDAEEVTRAVPPTPPLPDPVDSSHAQPLPNKRAPTVEQGQTTQQPEAKRPRMLSPETHVDEPDCDIFTDFPPESAFNDHDVSHFETRFANGKQCYVRCRDACVEPDSEQDTEFGDESDTEPDTEPDIDSEDDVAALITEGYSECSPEPNPPLRGFEYYCCPTDGQNRIFRRRDPDYESDNVASMVDDGFSECSLEPDHPRLGYTYTYRDVNGQLHLFRRRDSDYESESEEADLESDDTASMINDGFSECSWPAEGPLCGYEYEGRTIGGQARLFRRRDPDYELESAPDMELDNEPKTEPDIESKNRPPMIDDYSSSDSTSNLKTERIKSGSSPPAPETSEKQRVMSQCIKPELRERTSLRQSRLDTFFKPGPTSF